MWNPDRFPLLGFRILICKRAGWDLETLEGFGCHDILKVCNPIEVWVLFGMIDGNESWDSEVILN